MTDIILKDECYAIQGAVYEVHRRLGNGFLEAVYQECLQREFIFRNIPFVAQRQLKLFYREEPIGHTYRVDFVCYDSIIVEIKSVAEIIDAHKAQIMNYLKMSRMRLGLLVNFGHYPKTTIDRIVN